MSHTKQCLFVIEFRQVMPDRIAALSVQKGEPTRVLFDLPVGVFQLAGVPELAADFAVDLLKHIIEATQGPVTHVNVVYSGPTPPSTNN